MRTVAAVALFGLAGCDRLLGLHDVELPPDAAPYLVCSELDPAPFVCADFATASYYTAGTAAALPSAATGASIETRAPATSPPSALWIDSQGGQYELDVQPAGPNITHAHATFALQVAFAPPSYAFEVVRVGWSGAAPCYALAQVDAAKGVGLLVECPARLPVAVVFSGIPIDWASCSLDLDAGHATATMTVGTNSTVVNLPPGLVGGPPVVAAGVLHAQTPGPGPNIALDDLYVTVGP